MRSGRQQWTHAAPEAAMRQGVHRSGPAAGSAAATPAAAHQPPFGRVQLLSGQQPAYRALAHMRARCTHMTVLLRCGLADCLTFRQCEAAWKLLELQPDFGLAVLRMQQAARAVQRAAHANTQRLLFDQAAVHKVCVGMWVCGVCTPLGCALPASWRPRFSGMRHPDSTTQAAGCCCLPLVRPREQPTTGSSLPSAGAAGAAAAGLRGQTALQSDACARGAVTLRKLAALVVGWACRRPSCNCGCARQ
jgi:hypothetical protein